MGLKSTKSKDDPPDRPDPAALSDEALKLHRHRYREARKAGMGWTDAKLFAAALEIDVEAMRALARTGCPPHLLLRIL